MRRDLLTEKFIDELFKNEELKKEFEEKALSILKDLYKNPGFIFGMVAEYHEEKNKFSLIVYEFVESTYLRLFKNQIHLFNLESSYYVDTEYLENKTIDLRLLKEYEEEN